MLSIPNLRFDIISLFIITATILIVWEGHFFFLSPSLWNHSFHIHCAETTIPTCVQLVRMTLRRESWWERAIYASVITRSPWWTFILIPLFLLLNAAQGCNTDAIVPGSARKTGKTSRSRDFCTGLWAGLCMKATSQPEPVLFSPFATSLYVSVAVAGEKWQRGKWKVSQPCRHWTQETAQTWNWWGAFAMAQTATPRLALESTLHTF